MKNTCPVTEFRMVGYAHQKRHATGAVTRCRVTRSFTGLLQLHIPLVLRSFLPLHAYCIQLKSITISFSSTSAAHQLNPTTTSLTTQSTSPPHHHVRNAHRSHTIQQLPALLRRPRGRRTAVVQHRHTPRHEMPHAEWRVARAGREARQMPQTHQGGRSLA